MKRWLVSLAALGLAVSGYLYLNPELRSRWMQGTPLAEEPVLTPLYQWQDERGRWQVSDQPPAEGTLYRVRQYRRDTNIFPLPPELRPED
jgi:hypothetical protein